MAETARTAWDSTMYEVPAAAKHDNTSSLTSATQTSRLAWDTGNYNIAPPNGHPYTDTMSNTSLWDPQHYDVVDNKQPSTPTLHHIAPTRLAQQSKPVLRSYSKAVVVLGSTPNSSVTDDYIDFNQQAQRQGHANENDDDDNDNGPGRPPRRLRTNGSYVEILRSSEDHMSL